MSDKKKMSIEEIMAACRTKDGGASPNEQGAAAEVTPSRTEEAGEPSKPAAEVKKSGATKDSQTQVGPGAQPATSKPATSKPATSKPATSKPATSKPAGPMSVAEMLAAARGEKAKSVPKAKPDADSEVKPVAKRAAEKGPAKASPKPPAAAKGEPVAAGGPKDTTSILTAARQGVKPGPMSKAEAAAQGQPVVAKKAVTVPSMPARPSYLQPATSPATSPAATAEPRRTFFASLVGVLFGSSLAVGFSSLFVTHLLWALGMARFMFPNILTEPPTIFKVGFPSDYGPGQVETKYVAQFGVWIVRSEYNGQSAIYALRTVCTHLGCTPNWLEGEQKFKCPCHGSGFYKDGINFEGPAPRPLERYSIRLAGDGQIEVDKSRKFNEELGQWKDATSYIPV